MRAKGGSLSNVWPQPPQYFTDFDSRYLEQSRGNVPCELHVREQSDEAELLPSVRADRSKHEHTM